MGTTHSGRRLGALPLWPLGLGGAVGLDLGRRCALGVCSLPLRPLGLCQRLLGLDSRASCGASGLPSGSSFLVWCIPFHYLNLILRLSGHCLLLALTPP